MKIKFQLIKQSSIFFMYYTINAGLNHGVYNYTPSLISIINDNIIFFKNLPNIEFI